MKKELIVWILGGVIVWILLSSFWSYLHFQQKADRDLRLKELKLRICYDYNPQNGDYYWRHNNCKNLEREILEFKLTP